MRHKRISTKCIKLKMERGKDRDKMDGEKKSRDNAKKKLFIEAKIAVPENVEVKIEEKMVSVKGEKGSVKKAFPDPQTALSLDNKHIIIRSGKATRKNRAIVGTYNALIKNMVKGVIEGFEYRLKVCAAHFPMTITAQNNTFTVKNFLGEKKDRVMDYPSTVGIRVEGQDITVEGIDKEEVSQTAANIEQLCSIKGKDRRIFQDGIYIVSKSGKEIL